MAQINDLDIKSILNMSHDEGIEHLRQLRLSRRVPVQSKKAKPTNKAKAKPKLTKAQASNLLKDLEGLIK